MADSGPKFRFVISTNPAVPTSPYLSVAEDIEWMRDSWLSRENPPMPPELRRGSAVLRRLLVDGLIHEAWHYHGLAGAPEIVAPDLMGALALVGHETRHVIFAIAGGGMREGKALVALRAVKAQNPETGTSADADEGFAVVTAVIARAAGNDHDANDYRRVTDAVWRIPSFLDSVGAVRLGSTISRGSIIKYFANHAGGVHLDRIKTGPIRAEYQLLEALEQTSTALDLNGVYFELFSIGQAIGSSPAFERLEAAIRLNRAAPRHRNPKEEI